MIKINTVFIFLIVTATSFAQAPITGYSTNWWNGIVGHYQLSDKWGLYDELHIRRANYLETWQQFLFRPGINYFMNDNITLTLGYTYIQTYPYGSQPVPTVIPENNIWQQVVLKHKTGKVSITHRYRWEERFSGKAVWDNLKNDYKISGTNYSNRFRYRLIIGVPLKGNWSFTIYDELFVSIDKKIQQFNFDQNWITGLVNYKFTDKLKVSVGMMQQYVRKADGIHYENNPTIQLGIGYKFDFRRKSEE
jgi:hypothetical protein